MTHLVVDASVAAKWVLPEAYADAAERLLLPGYRLLAPDLIYAEFANIIWKLSSRGLLDREQAAARGERFLTAPLEVYPSKPLLLKAVDLAIQTRRTAYDCLYLSLAVRESCEMVTADERLVNALASGPFEHYVRWIGSM